MSDVDADFLAFYGIDLRSPNHGLSAEAFCSRAFRLFNYRGAMRDALQAEMHEQEKRGGVIDTPPAVQAPTPAPVQHRSQPRDSSGTKWVSPDEMRVLFPDLFQGG